MFGTFEDICSNFGLGIWPALAPHLSEKRRSGPVCLSHSFYIPGECIGDVSTPRDLTTGVIRRPTFILPCKTHGDVMEIYI